MNGLNDLDCGELPRSKPITRKIILLPSTKLTIKHMEEHTDINRKVLTEQVQNLPYEQFTIKSNPDEHRNMSELDIMCEERLQCPPVFLPRPHLMQLPTDRPEPSFSSSNLTAKASQLQARQRTLNIKALRGARFYEQKASAIQKDLVKQFEGFHEEMMEHVNKKKIIRLKSRRYQSGLEPEAKLATSRKTKETRSLETRNSKIGNSCGRFLQVTLANSPSCHENLSAWLTPHKPKDHNSLMFSQVNLGKLSKSLGIKIVSRSVNKNRMTTQQQSRISPGCQIKAALCPYTEQPQTVKYGTSIKREKLGKPIKTISHIMPRKARPIKLFKKKSQSFTSLR